MSSIFSSHQINSRNPQVHTYIDTFLHLSKNILIPRISFLSCYSIFLFRIFFFLSYYWQKETWRQNNNLYYNNCTQTKENCLLHNNLIFRVIIRRNAKLFFYRRKFKKFLPFMNTYFQIKYN